MKTLKVALISICFSMTIGLPVLAIQEADQDLSEVKHALASAERKSGENHTDTELSLFNLASLYVANGRFSEAEKLSVRLLKMTAKPHGRYQLKTAERLDDLADQFEKLGKYAQAERLMLRSLTIKIKMLGRDHKDVGDSLLSLGEFYRDLGQYRKAIPYLKSSLSVWEKAGVGPEHKRYDTEYVLAAVYYGQGQFDLAESLIRHYFYYLESVDPGSPGDSAVVLSNLAGVHRAKGQIAQATDLYQRSLAMLENRWLADPDDPELYEHLLNLASILKAQNLETEAMPFCERASKLRDHVFTQPWLPEHLGQNSLTNQIRRDRGLDPCH